MHVADAEERFGIVEAANVGFNLLVREAAEVFRRQTNDEERPADDIVELSVRIAEGSVGRKVDELSFVVADECYIIIPRINRLNIPTNGFLKGFQRVWHLHLVCCFIRFDTNDFHIQCILSKCCFFTFTPDIFFATTPRT